MANEKKAAPAAKKPRARAKPKAAQKDNRGRPPEAERLSRSEARKRLRDFFETAEMDERFRTAILAELDDPKSRKALTIYLHEQAYGKAKATMELEGQVDLGGLSTSSWERREELRQRRLAELRELQDELRGRPDGAPSRSVV